MKAKIKLEKGETIEQAEERFKKAFKAKNVNNLTEKYDEDVFNEFHAFVVKNHKKLLESLAEEIKDEIIKHAAIHGYHK